MWLTGSFTLALRRKEVPIIRDWLVLFVIGFGLEVLMMAVIPSLNNKGKGWAYSLHLVGALVSCGGIWLLLTSLYQGRGMKIGWLALYALAQALLSGRAFTSISFQMGFTISSALSDRGRHFSGRRMVIFSAGIIVFCILLVWSYCSALAYVASRPWSHRPAQAISVLLAELCIAILLPLQIHRLGALPSSLEYRIQTWQTERMSKRIDELLGRNDPKNKLRTKLGDE